MLHTPLTYRLWGCQKWWEFGLGDDEFLSRTVAMKAMNKVASHINEMQKLHEEYGAVFDQLINEQTADRKEVNMNVLFNVDPLWIQRIINCFFFTAINLRWLTSPWGIFCCILLWCGSTLQPLWSRAKRTLIWLLLVRLKCGFWVRLWNWFDPITDCLLLLYLHFIDLNLEAGIYIQNRLILRW